MLGFEQRVNAKGEVTIEVQTPNGDVVDEMSIEGATLWVAAFEVAIRRARTIEEAFEDHG